MSGYLKKSKGQFAAVCILAASSLFAGCSSELPGTTTGASETIVGSPSPSPEASKSAQKAADEYFVAAKSSCELAQSKGVVESGKGFKVVAVPKADSYQGYSAAYLEDPGTYELIWELDSLTVCADYFSISMAEDAGQPWPLEVSYDPKSGSYIVFEDFGEYGTSNLAYSVSDGVITKVTDLAEQGTAGREIRYGNLSQSDLLILKTAVDRFLKQG